MALSQPIKVTVRERVGRPAHKPNPETRNAVNGMAAAGLWQYEIAKMMGMSENTLVKHYSDELNTGWVTTMALASKVIFDQMERETDRAFDAAKFFLTKRGRGLWSEKNQIELTGTKAGSVNNQPLNIGALDVDERYQLEHLLKAALVLPSDTKE